jgi:hypothetical protein
MARKVAWKARKMAPEGPKTKVPGPLGDAEGKGYLAL